MRFFQSLVLLASAASLQAYAVPIVTLHAANLGIDSISVNVTGTTITIDEIWASDAPGFLEISGLDAGVNYTVVKNITNNSAVPWTSLANELLDPLGFGGDPFDVLPYPDFVPPGYSTSNNQDGLSFAQGSGLPRMSLVFPNLVVDETSDTRDFLDFSGGVLGIGEVDTVTYGLLDQNPDANSPFLLSQRPNATSNVPTIGTFGLMVAGVLGLSVFGRRRTKTSA
ncbi:MAG: hypothetical protein K0U93_00065 [Gammaproteobacteria bacterium]|nr:hypothetical protein [Gammaproteobacteria bacterium]